MNEETFQPGQGGGVEVPVFGMVEGGRVLQAGPLFVVFLDKFPVSPGHTLIVPRCAVQCFAALTAAERVGLMECVGWCQGHLCSVLDPVPEGWNLGVNDGPAAGQTVAQFHFHVIPRYTGDVPDPRGGIRWVVADKARYW